MDAVQTKDFRSMRYKKELCGNRAPINTGAIALQLAEIKSKMVSMSRAERKKVVAMLACHYSVRKLAEALGVSPRYVCNCCKEHREIIESAALARNSMIAEMTEHRVMELLGGMDIGKIEDYKKPQAVKYLMDSMAIAKEHSKPKEESESRETVSELIFRVRQKMGARPEKAIDMGEVEVEDVKDQEGPEGDTSPGISDKS